MKKLVLAVLLCGTVLAQDRAPSPQQCIADANRWYLINLDQPALDKLSFDELGRRGAEMLACGASGAPTPHFYENPLMEDYPHIFSIYDNAQGKRMAAYIKRHGLSHEFLAEDAAGQR
jgi:hypothetical protein